MSGARPSSRSRICSAASSAVTSIPSARETASAVAPSSPRSRTVSAPMPRLAAGHDRDAARQFQVHPCMMPGRPRTPSTGLSTPTAAASSCGSPTTSPRPSPSPAIQEGMALVSAMHITAGVVDQRRRARHPRGHARVGSTRSRPPSWKEPSNGVARALGPRPGRLQAPRGRRGQRGRALEEPARAPPGGDPGDRRAGSILARGRPVFYASSTAAATSGWSSKCRVSEVELRHRGRRVLLRFRLHHRGVSQGREAFDPPHGAFATLRRTR